jgi:hypothetical protein
MNTLSKESTTLHRQPLIRKSVKKSRFAVKAKKTGQQTREYSSDWDWYYAV